MYIFVCDSCHSGFRVIEDDIDRARMLIGESSDVGKVVCPRCAAALGRYREIEVDGTVMRRLKVTDLTTDEMYAALNGFGLPEEVQCSRRRVQEVLENTKIKKVVGRDTAAGRFVIDSILFEDNKRMYLGASSEGAVVYRISEPYDYATKVLEENG